MEDIEIARNTKLENIKNIAAKAGIADDELDSMEILRLRLIAKNCLIDWKIEKMESLF